LREERIEVSIPPGEGNMAADEESTEIASEDAGDAPEAGVFFAARFALFA